MGEVVPFKKPVFSACPCGWRAPKNIQVQLHAPHLADHPVELCIVCFDCPTCGTRLQMGQISDQEVTT